MLLTSEVPNDMPYGTPPVMKAALVALIGCVSLPIGVVVPLIFTSQFQVPSSQSHNHVSYMIVLYTNITTPIRISPLGRPPSLTHTHTPRLSHTFTLPPGRATRGLISQRPPSPSSQSSWCSSPSLASPSLATSDGTWIKQTTQSPRCMLHCHTPPTHTHTLPLLRSWGNAYPLFYSEKWEVIVDESPFPELRRTYSNTYSPAGRRLTMREETVQAMQ